MSNRIDAVLIGAGQRGTEVYGAYALAHPDRLRFVAVAEPDAQRRQRFSAAHRIVQENQFENGAALLEKAPLARVAVIATQDWQHTQSALAAMRAGYAVLLEKPMATLEAECRQLVQTSHDTGQPLHIAHVLRYTRHFQKIQELLQSGVIGDVIDVDHRENVSFWHMAHSYVRGNWNDSQKASPMILAKCCHDLDILLWLLDRRCLRLSSIGSLSHYRAENAPQGAPKRCTDGCPVQSTCPYSAPWIYETLDPLWRSFADTNQGLEGWLARVQERTPGVVRALSRVAPILRQMSAYDGWPLTVLAGDPTPEAVHQALLDGPYGRCVYACDNNVVDHQVVSMEFEGGLSVTLGMHGHSHTEYRTTRIEGTRGRILAEFGLGGAWVQLDEHRSDRTTRFDTGGKPGENHGGGDFELISAFLMSLQSEAVQARTTAAQALQSHILAFAAERARLQGCVIPIDD